MVTPRFLPLTGGVELHVDQVARRLAQRGMSVTILTTDTTRSLPVSEVIHGVNVRRVPAWPSRRDYYFAPRIYSHVVDEDCDVVHVQSYHTFVAPFAMLAARRANRPYVVTFHGGGHSSRLRHAARPIQLRALRPLLAGASRLIALVPHEIEAYSRGLAIPRARFALIPNGSDLPATLARSLPREPALIASIGRLERYKGHHRVIAALPHLIRHRPEARLWIAGTGPEEAALRRLAASLDVADRVDIRAVPVEDRERYAIELSRVSVVVLMSEFETQPIAALEAAALGCRLLVARSPGLAALAQQGLASTIPLGASPRDLAGALLDELDRPPPPRADLPTWDECAERLLEVYASVANEANGQPVDDASTAPGLATRTRRGGRVRRS
jgi:glycosyltransferase involved in cell wall biosynthesis